MIAVLDVHYHDGGATAAGIAFREWADAAGTVQKVISLSQVAEYQPGHFYLRELPCLLAVLKVLPPVDTVIVDGYVWLEGGRPGLGARLHEALGGHLAVVGAAKTRFRGAEQVREVLRGDSARPLYVSAVGMDLDQAAQQVRAMHGEFRLPTLLKAVDRLCREGDLTS